MANLLLLFSIIPLLSSLSHTSSSSAIPPPPPPAPAPFNFSFSFATPTSTSTSTSPHHQIHLLGGAHFTNSSLAILPSGLALYSYPIKFLPPTPAFSTYFSFSFSPSPINAAADFTFFLTLATLIPIPMDSNFPPPTLISVRFLATAPLTHSAHNNASHLEIHVGGVVPLLSTMAHLLLTDGQKLHSWVDYNGTSNRLELRLGRSRTARPWRPILSYPMDLSSMLCREAMVVGFSSSSTHNTNADANANASQVLLYEWNFVAHHGTPYLMHSEPLDPTKSSARPTDRDAASARMMRQMSHPWAVVLALIFAAACGAMVTFFALFVWLSVCAHRPVAPVEYPVHPAEVIYEKMVVVGMKEACAKQQLQVGQETMAAPPASSSR